MHPSQGLRCYIFFKKFIIVEQYWTDTLASIYIVSSYLPLTHMYSVEPSSRRLNCTGVKTGQRRWAPLPRCIIPFSSFIHGRNGPAGYIGLRNRLILIDSWAPLSKVSMYVINKSPGTCLLHKWVLLHNVAAHNVNVTGRVCY